MCVQLRGKETQVRVMLCKALSAPDAGDEALDKSQSYVLFYRNLCGFNVVA